MTRSREVRAATVEIGGIACRIACRHAKPALWAEELHPAFLSSRPPEVELAITYDRTYWARGLPWVAPNTVSHEPTVSREGDGLTVTTSYFEARMATGARRIDVRMASGFRIDALMQTLTGLLLLERGGFLLRGVRRISAGRAVLRCGPSGDGGRQSRPAWSAERFDGLVAVVPGDGGVLTFATPFHADGTSLAPVPVAVADSLYLARPNGPPQPVIARPPAVAAGLLPHVTIADRSAIGVARLLDATIELLRQVPGYVVSEAWMFEAPARACAFA